tara:strand:- start:281 stop:430 length:150 start_codon:yes stop_codon:yes gene_type:complete
MESEERIKSLEKRIEKLELHSHPPIDWEKRIDKLEEVYIKLINKIKEKQ